MNDKENTLDKIIDIVAKCTSYESVGLPVITRKQLLGDCRNENVSMARSILVLQLKHEGYTVTTIAALLGRTEQAIRKLITKGYNNISSSRVCRKAAAQIVLEVEKLYE